MRRIATNTNAQAIAWITLATTLFSLLYASGKFGDGAASLFQILFLRYAGGLLTLIAMVARSGEPLRSYRSRHPFGHFMRTVFAIAGTLALIHASATMPIVDATAIGLLYVVFVVPLGALVLKEKVTRRHLAGILLCCTGAAVIVGSRGAFVSFQASTLWPAAMSVLGAAFLAIEGLLIRVLSSLERAFTILLHVNGFGLLLTAAPAVATWQPLSFGGALPFLLLGPIVVAGQYCIARGYRLASLAVVGPVDYTWLVFAALIGFVFFGEVPTLATVLGSLCIAGGGIVLVLAGPDG